MMMMMMGFWRGGWEGDGVGLYECESNSYLVGCKYFVLT